MAVKIETLELEIRSQAEQASKGIEHLSSALKELKSSTLRKDSIATLTRNLSNLNEALGQIESSKVNTINKLSHAMDRLAKASAMLKGVGKVGKNFTDISEAVKNQERINKAKRGLTKTYQPGADVTKVVDAYSQMGSRSFAGGLIKNSLANGWQATLTKLDSAFNSFATRMRSALISLPNVIGKCTTSAIAFGASLTKAIGGRIANKVKALTKRFTDFFKSIKRIAVYRLIRSAIKAITQGFQEGVKAVSNYSRSIGGDFAKTMDSLTSQIALMNASLGAMSAPLIQMLAPAIMTVTNAVISLANAINQVLSLLSGKSGWTKATSAVKQYDDAVSGASNSQKSLTAGLDELNVLNEGSGGGGGAGTADYDFSEMSFDSWAVALKKQIDAGNWQDIGESLANKLNSIVESWDSTAWGQKIGDKIQNAIELSYGFWKNLDTETMGNKVADFLNNGLSRINTNMLGRTLGEKVNRVVDFIYGLDTWTNWTQLSNKIVDFFKGAFEAFNVSKLTLTVNNLLNNVMKFTADTLSGLTDLHVGKSIISFFKNLNWTDIGINTGKLISAILDASLTLAGDLLEGYQSGSLSISLYEYISNAIKNIDWDLLLLELRRDVTQLIGGTFNIVESLLIAGLDALNGKDFEQSFRDAQNKGPISSWCAYDVERYNAKIDALKKKMPNDYQEVLSATEARAKASGVQLAQTAQSNADSLASAYDRAKESINSALDSISGKAEETTSKMSYTAVEMGNTVAQPWASFDSLGNKADETSRKAGESFANIQRTTETSWSQIKSTTEKDWDTIQKKVESTWSQLDEKATERFENIHKTISDKWQAILDDTTAKWGIEGNIPTLVKNGLASMEGAFTAMADSISQSLDKAYSSVDSFVTNACRRFDELISKLDEYNNAKPTDTDDISISRTVRGYATGGMVSSGNLFFANENGIPELVGSIGNTTAVMNNDQIVSAVSSGVYNAVLSAMGQSNNSAQSVNVYLDGKQIEASTRNTKQRRGATIATGGIYNFA